jgi:hypothetical protein
MQIVERHCRESKVLMSQHIGDVRGFFSEAWNSAAGRRQRFEMAPVHAGKVD